MMDNMVSDLLYVSPLFALVLGSMLLLIYEVFIKRPWSRGAFTFLVLLSAFAINTYLYLKGLFPETGTAFYGQFYIDRFSGLMNSFLLLVSSVVTLISLGQLETEKVNSEGEYYSLYLMSVTGAIIFNSAAEFITLFIGLEIMSMALYCLCGSALSRRNSSESALKYFLLGSFSSAFLLYGIALIYGLTGSMEYISILQSLSGLESPLQSMAIGLILVGLLFKIAAVPFHFWAPDVYQGAPTSVTVFMASVIKASAVLVMLRVLWMVFPDSVPVWSGAIWTMAVITMTIGNLTALRQRSLKRMLAYSSIAHAGYMMVGLLVANSEFGGAAAVVYYLIAYTAVTLGSLAVVLSVAAPYLDTPHSDDISRFNGLASRQPVIAALMALFMLSLAGIPPGMSGLLAKFFIFNSAVKAGYIGLAIIGMLNSAISVYYYLRVIVAMYFIEAKSGETYSKPQISLPIYSALTVCALAVVLLGLFPSRVYKSAKEVVDPVLSKVRHVTYFDENPLNQ